LQRTVHYMKSCAHRLNMRRSSPAAELSSRSNVRNFRTGESV
jgi:hypothetical protein